MAVGGGYGDAAQHSQTLFALFGHLPGLKVISPVLIFAWAVSLSSLLEFPVRAMALMPFLLK